MSDFLGEADTQPRNASRGLFAPALGRFGGDKNGTAAPSGSESKIKQVKEPGLLTLPRLSEPRTAMPTTQGFFTLSHHQIHRGCKTAIRPAVGVMTAQNCRIARIKYGVTAGVAPIRKEMNHVREQEKICPVDVPGNL